MKVRKKIFLAGLTILLLLVTTVSTTFAWFSLNDAAWVDDFDLEIYSTDKLLIRHETGNYKQVLTTDDVVDAINNGRESGHITELDDISLTSVHSQDGLSFFKLQPTYDDMNRQSVSLVTADVNSYLLFKLIFTVDSTAGEGQVRPEYHLKFSQNVEAGGVKKTSFTANNQTIKLVNQLVTPSGIKNAGDNIVVNPVNALRLSVKSNQSQNYIYEFTESNSLGSYACYDLTLNELGKTSDSDKRYSCSTNAAHTYFNEINNDILKPLGYFETGEEKEAAVDYVSELLGKVKYNFSDSLGVFGYDEELQSYNEVALTLGIWLEGFDADNLIGLDANKINCLLSFAIEKGGSI